jgi:hypothetical protein
MSVVEDTCLKMAMHDGYIMRAMFIYRSLNLGATEGSVMTFGI